MNQIIFDGNIKEKPELNQDSSGDYWCQINVANNRYSTTEERGTNWYTVFLRGKMAVNLCKYCDKGSRVIVRGTQKLEWITGNDGVKKLSVTVSAQEVSYLYTSGNNSVGNYSANTYKDDAGYPLDSRKNKQSLDGLDNDIPF